MKRHPNLNRRTSAFFALTSLLAPCFGAQDLPALSLNQAEDLTDSGKAAIRAGVDGETTVFVGQTVEFGLYLEFDAEFQDERLVPLFRQPLDLPVQVQAPWLSELAGAEVRELEASPVTGLSFALGDRRSTIARGPTISEELRNRHTYFIRRELIPKRSGPLVLSAPVLRLAYATRFEESLLEGRQPADRVDAFVRGLSLELDVLDWPEQGRPPGFAGAVGAFDLQAHAYPTLTDDGNELVLSLVLTGKGASGPFEPLDLSRLEGFALRGVDDDRGRLVRTWRYHLVPEHGDVTEIPALEFVYLDPTPPGVFRSVRTAPLPVDLGQSIPNGPAELLPPAHDEDQDAGPSPLVAVLLVLLPLALLSGFALWFVRTRRRHSTELPAADAVRAFEARIGAESPDLAAALAEVLGARMGCTPAAVIGPDLVGRLTAAGVSTDTSRRASLLLDQLVHAKYGGGSVVGCRERCLELVRALHVS